MNQKILTDYEFKEIKEKVIAGVKDLDSGNLGIRHGDVDDRDEVTGSVSCTDADARVARARYVVQRENVNHMRALEDIPTDEGNHNISYDTTGNHTIIHHPSVNRNIKTNSNPIKRRSD